MQITIRLYGSLRDILPSENKGQTRLDLPAGSTVGDALKKVGLPDDGYYTAVNGENIDQNSRPLEDGDYVLVFAPAAGG